MKQDSRNSNLSTPLVVAIEWKRGAKGSGRTEMVTLTEGAKMDFSQKFENAATMLKDKKGYLSKKVAFSLDSYQLDKNKVYKKVKNIATADFNLAQSIGEENEEKKTNQSIPFKLGRSIAFLKVEFIASKPKGFVVDDDDELSESGTTGSDSEMAKKGSFTLERSNSNMEKSTKEVDTLKQQILLLEGEKSTYEVKIRLLEDNILQLSNRKEDNGEEKIAELLKELQIKMDELSQSETEVGQLTQKILEINKDHETTLKKMSEEHQSVLVKLESSKMEVAQQVKQMGTLKETLNKEFEIKSKEKEGLILEMKSQLESIQKENKELETWKSTHANLEVDAEEMATLKPLFEKVKRENHELKTREKKEKIEKVELPLSPPIQFVEKEK
jgi:hypothetical protein